MLGQAYKSGRLLASGDGKPYPVCTREGNLQLQEPGRGGSVEPHKPTDEVSAQQEHVTPHGCGGGVAVEGSLPGDHVASSPRAPSVDNSENRPAAPGKPDGTSAHAVPEGMGPGDLKLECPVTFPEEDEWRSPPRANESNEFHSGEEHEIESPDD